MDGVIAASAPIWSFLDLEPAYNPNEFYRGVAFDATSAGGAAEHCEGNLKSAWPSLIEEAKTAAGRKIISESFKLCEPLEDPDDVHGLIDFCMGPWGSMAMGNYPYPSSYIMHGLTMLPAWPMRKACEGLAKPEMTGAELYVRVSFNISAAPHRTAPHGTAPHRKHHPFVPRSLRATFIQHHSLPSTALLVPCLPCVARRTSHAPAAF